MKRFISLLWAFVLVFAAVESYPAAAEVLPSRPDDSHAVFTDEPLPVPTDEPAALYETVPEPVDSPTPPPTANPLPEPEPAAENKSENQKTPAEKKRFYIMVNNACNTVNIYEKDAEGYYTLPYKAMVCSTGDATPKSGAYRPGILYRWQELFGNVYGQYCTQITGNILFHSVPYLTYYDPGSLEYWEFDRLGTSCSAGCIRLQVKDAKWIYDNAYQIEAIEFYSSQDPGPFGKPDAPLISDNVEYRGWDPSDPDPDNPWITGVVPFRAENENSDMVNCPNLCGQHKKPPQCRDMKF